MDIIEYWEAINSNIYIILKAKGENHNFTRTFEKPYSNKDYMIGQVPFSLH